MELYLSSLGGSQYLKNIDKIIYALESFYYIKEWQLYYIKNVWRKFLLDSGAFTFLNTKGKNTARKEIELYLYRYINFINKNDISYFFEMDLDTIVGLKTVEEYRKIIEKETGKRCIPVWHKSRGQQYFIDLASEYDYIAIGGIAIKDIKKDEYKYFKWFIDEAHKRKCRIHGLGYTSIKGLKKYKFDSVDSTSWQSGSRYGTLYKFQNNTLISKVFKDYRVSDYKKLNYHNLNEWIKFQKYMDKF